MIRSGRRPPLSLVRRSTLHLALVAAVFGLLPACEASAGLPTDQLRSAVDQVLKILSDPELKNEARTLERRRAIRIVASERFARADQSVTGQVLKMMSAKPDAVLIAAVGGPAVLPQATLYDQSYKGRVYQTHAVATDEFIRLGKEKVEGTVLASGSMLVINDVAPGDPIRKVALAYISAYEKQFGQRPATFGANTYDAGLLLQQAIPIALKSAKPGTEAFRTALRDALEQQRDITGCQGVFNMSPTNHNGMDERARVLVIVRDGRFRLLPE